MNKDMSSRIAVEYDGNQSSGLAVEYDGGAVDAINEESNASLVDDLPTSIDFEVMAFGGQATVCATAPKQGRRSTAYQSEAELEKAFIAQLQR